MRGDLTAEEWSIIGALLPPERGRGARPAQDNRRFLNGLLSALRVGRPWRDMHERYGKWNSVYVRCHSQAAGAEGGLIRRSWVEAAVAARARSTPVPTVRAALSASSSPPARSPTTRASNP